MQQRPLSLGNHEPEKAPFSFLSGGSSDAAFWNHPLAASAASLAALSIFSISTAAHARTCSIWNTGYTTLSVSEGTIKAACTSLSIRNNGSLTSIDLSGLSKVDHLIIEYNDALTSIDLPGLSKMRDLVISDNHVLTSIDLPGLSKVGDLVISDNYALTSIDLSGLREPLKKSPPQALMS